MSAYFLFNALDEANYFGDGCFFMAKEIERKFLIDKSILIELKDGFHISQGYIETTTKSVVRARIKNDLAFLTLKGETKGMTCSEFEYEIPVQDAKEIISELCQGNTVDKTRYEIKHGQHLWEVDVFHGENEGLVIAEVELSDESESVEFPEWVVEEVTGQQKYFNSSLLKTPFLKW